MQTFIAWLEKRKVVNSLIVIAYIAFIIGMHDVFVNISVWIMDTLTPSKYNQGVAIGSTLTFIALALYLRRNFKKYPGGKEIKVGFFLAMASLIVLHMQALFVINIEIIHAFQFGFLAILLYPLTHSFGRTMFYCTLLGVVDEFFQYRVWHSLGADYLDFNDIIMNQLGIGVAIVLISVSGVQHKLLSLSNWYKSPVFIITFLIALAMIVMYKTGLVQTYSEDTNSALFALSKYPEPLPFWLKLRTSEIIYHVLTPLEGTIIMTTLIGMFYLFDLLLKKKLLAYLKLNVIGLDFLNNLSGSSPSKAH